MFPNFPGLREFIQSVLCRALTSWHFHKGFFLKRSGYVQWVSGIRGTIPAPSFLHLVHQERILMTGRKRGQTWLYSFLSQNIITINFRRSCACMCKETCAMCFGSVHQLHPAQNQCHEPGEGWFSAVPPSGSCGGDAQGSTRREHRGFLRSCPVFKCQKRNNPLAEISEPIFVLLLLTEFPPGGLSGPVPVMEQAVIDAVPSLRSHWLPWRRSSWAPALTLALDARKSSAFPSGHTLINAQDRYCSGKPSADPPLLRGIAVSTTVEVLGSTATGLMSHCARYWVSPPGKGCLCLCIC